MFCRAWARPFQTDVVDFYADDPNIAVIGVEYAGPESLVESWLDTYGWTFPVAVNDGDNRIYQEYGFATGGYDTFFIIRPDGVVQHVEGYPNSTADFPRIKQALETAAATVPVEPLTWGRIKSLY